MARNLDMFSFLPESLLVIIVSFLPFKEAARTCVLSKEWLEIWKSTKNIEFSELFFVKPGQSDETKEVQRRVFLNFITHWIANYKDQFVDKFSLKVSVPENISHIIESCVSFATQCGVKELELDFSDPNWEENNFNYHDALFELPKHVYGHESLESLKLYSCSFVMPDLLYFGALKDVSLGWIKASISTVKTLLSTCKTIENLNLKKCWNLADFDMSDEKLGLRRLVINKCDFDHHYFRFNAPNLKFFKYSGFMGVFDIDNVQQDVMEQAEIDFALMTQYDKFGNELYKLLEDLYPVKVLTVDSFLLQVVPSGDEPMRTQRPLNVRHLILKTQLHPYELCGFRFLLNSCPMLEKLTLELDSQLIFPNYRPPYLVNFKQFWELRPQIIYTCLETTLKVVEVRRFRGSNVARALRYLIRCGKVLETLNINVLKEENGDPENVEMRHKKARVLLTVPKASINLQITIG